MSNFDRCPNCGKYDFQDNHKCGKQWEAYLLDYGFDNQDDPSEDTHTRYKAFGNKPTCAAEDLAEEQFSNWDYPEVIEIWLREDSKSEWIKVGITVETVPQFSGTIIERKGAKTK